MKYLLVLLMATSAQAQVSIFTNPDSDTIVFETTTTTYEVTPKFGPVEVVIPSGYGYSSTYSVGPGGFVTPTFETHYDKEPDNGIISR